MNMMNPQGGVAMSVVRANAGVDVAKRHLDACWADAELRLLNDARGWDELIAKLQAARVDLVSLKSRIS